MILQPVILIFRDTHLSSHLDDVNFDGLGNGCYRCIHRGVFKRILSRRGYAADGFLLTTERKIFNFKHDRLNILYLHRFICQPKFSPPHHPLTLTPIFDWFMKRGTSFKVDVYSLNNIDAPVSDRKYFGSITGYTELDVRSLTHLLQFDATKSLVEGVEILSYALGDFVLYEVTGLLFDGELFKNALYNAADLRVANEPIPEFCFVSTINAAYFLLGDETTTNQVNDYDFDFLKGYCQYVIKHQTIFEWGASGFWEGYILGVSPADAIELLKRLKTINFPGGAIWSFKLPDAIINRIADYKMTPQNVFLKSYQKKGKTEKITLRSINYRFHVTMKNKELTDIKTEALQVYL